MSGVVTVSRALTPRNWTAAVDPTNGDNAADGVRVGDHWYNTASGNVFVCVANTVGAAVWRHIPRTWANPTAYSLTGTTSETSMAAATIPSGAMGTNGALRITVFWSYPNNANNKSMRIRFGTVGSGTGGTQFQGATATTTVAFQDIRIIKNQAATNVQRSYVGGAATGIGASTGAVSAGAIDTTVASDVSFTGQLGSSADTLILEMYLVELTRPDIT